MSNFNISTGGDMANIPMEPEKDKTGKLQVPGKELHIRTLKAAATQGVLRSALKQSSTSVNELIDQIVKVREELQEIQAKMTRLNEEARLAKDLGDKHYIHVNYTLLGKLVDEKSDELAKKISYIPKSWVSNQEPTEQHKAQEEEVKQIERKIADNDQRVENLTRAYTTLENQPSQSAQIQKKMDQIKKTLYSIKNSTEYENIKRVMTIIDYQLSQLRTGPETVTKEVELNDTKELLLKKREQIKNQLNELIKQDPFNREEQTATRVAQLEEELIDNSKEIREISTKLSYLSPEVPGPKPHVAELSGGINRVERVAMTYNEAIKKTFTPDETQKAVQIEAFSALSESLLQANVVAARRIEGQVATQKVEGLVVGQDAIANMRRGSEATQHTSLAALSLQTWDLHGENIGIDQSKDMVLFDTDLTLYEDNDFVSNGPVLHSPLGHNALQDMNIEITDKVLDAHLDQLDNAIASQFLGKSHGFTKDEAAIILKHLIEHFANLPELQVYYDDQYGPNQAYAVKSVDDVKKEFLNIIKSDENRSFFETLLADEKLKIAKTKINLLEKRPELLHPKNLSIKQMAALIERRNHLRGFVELRKKLQNLNTYALTSQQLKAQKTLILQNIDHLPLRTSAKKALLKQLKSTDFEEIRIAIATVKALVGEKPIKWNTLAQSMYPTLAAMHAAAKKNAKDDNRVAVFELELTHNRKNYRAKVEKPLSQEISERTQFLKQLQELS